jgi:tRNA G37 N-methylase Trm5
MTDQELKDLVASLAADTNKIKAENAAGFAALREAQAKTDSQLAKTDAQFAKTDAKYASTIEMLNGITESQGLVAEEFFFNSLADALKVGGVQYDGITSNVKRKANGKQVEIDLMLDNGSSLAIIEVKYRARTKNVEQLQKTIATYRELFPHHKDFKIYGGIASFNLDDDVTAHAHEQGFFVLKRKGELMEVDTQGMKAF